MSVNTRCDPGLHPVHDYKDNCTLEVYYANSPPKPPNPPTADIVPASQTEQKIKKQDRKLILGIRKRTFWGVIGAIASVVVILVCVLAGVLTTKKDGSKPDKTSESASLTASPSSIALLSSSSIATSSPSSIATSSPSSTATTSTSAAYPIQTITKSGLSAYRTCPASDQRNYTTLETPGQSRQTFSIKCSWLPSFDPKSSTGPGAFVNDTDSLEKCIELCADFNVRNGTGGWGPCISVIWRTNENTDYWRKCWGGFGPKVDGRIGQGRFTNVSSSTDAPVDSAILMTA